MVSKYQKAFSVWQDLCPEIANKQTSFAPTIEYGGE
jgi:hypothetical protein